MSEDIFTKSAAADDIAWWADFLEHWFVPTRPGSTTFQPSGLERNRASQFGFQGKQKAAWTCFCIGGSFNNAR